MLVGWVKLHRETLTKAIWKCSTPEQKVIFITILMLANHTHNQWIWKGQKFECQPGQFITSIKSLADYAEVSVKNVRTALLKFEKLEFLANESAIDGRKVTVLNWDRYQNNTDEGGKPLARSGQTPGKASATIKEGEKEKNDKEDEEASTSVWKKFWNEEVKTIYGEHFVRRHPRSKIFLAPTPPINSNSKQKSDWINSWKEKLAPLNERLKIINSK